MNHIYANILIGPLPYTYLENIFVITVTEKLTRYLRNEFNFWYVHGIMNTSGLLQSK